MRTTIVYVADDGKQFSNQEACLKHEREIKAHDNAEKIKNSLSVGMRNINRKMNQMKSKSRDGQNLANLTQKRDDARKEYKEQLKKTDFSVRAMFQLFQVMRKAVFTYVEWDKANNEYARLKEMWRIGKEGEKELARCSYGK